MMLTLSPGAEGTCRDLVPQLASLLATELLAFLAGEQLLVVIHVILVLPHPMVADRGGIALAAITGRGLGTHRVQELRDLLLDDRVRRLEALGPLLRLRLAHCGLPLLLDHLLLLSLLGLSLGDGGLLVHAGPEPSDVAYLC
jgi:hypothetical protein